MRLSIKQIFPILEWIPNYKREFLKGDLSAGLTVGILLIPQGMAYAMIAGLSPIYGLYAAFIPQIIYSFFGTSRQLSVAPVAMISLLIASGVMELAAQGSERYLQMAIALSLLVGLLQWLFGVFRMGFIVNFLSQPVIKGYTSSAAIIIALSQLKHLLGVDMPSSNLIHEVIHNAYLHVDQTHIMTFAIGLGGLLLILVLKKINKQLPGSLIAVIASILLVYFLNLDENGVKIVGTVPQGLPVPGTPVIDLQLFGDLLPLALLISLVGFMESISIGKAIQAKRRNYEVNPNKELIGLGLANITGSFFSAFPVSGGFSRTAVNDQAGANTNISSLISAAIVGLTLIFLTPLFYYMPKAVLASIIMVAVLGLIDVGYALYLWKTDKKDLAMMLVTFLMTLLFGVQTGITAGVILSIAMVIHNSAYPHIARLGKLPDTNYFRNLSRFPEAIDREDALIFRFDAQLYFANINYFREKLFEMTRQKGDKLRVIILNAQSINGLDATAAKGLEDIVDNCGQLGVTFYMTEVIGPVRDAMKRTGLFDKIGKDHFHMRVYDALEHYDRNLDKSHDFASQSNVD